MSNLQLFNTVAIDPSLARVESISVCLRYKFGLQHGRVIAGLPRDWVNFARQQINQIDDALLKARLKSTLQTLELSGAILPKEGPFNRTKPWIEQVISQQFEQTYDVLITDEEVPAKQRYSSSQVEQYLDDSELKVGYLDVSGLKKAEEFLPYLEPFLQNSKKIVLVNRYQGLMSSRKERELFECVFNRWIALGGSDFTVIRSSVEQKSGPRTFATLWAEEVRELKRYFQRISFSGIFRFFAVNDERNRLHHRYLLGNYCGLSLDYGFEINDKPHPWTLLNKSHFVDARERFLVQDIQTTYPESRLFLYSQSGKRILE